MRHTADPPGQVARRSLRDGIVAGAVGAVVAGMPSTIHAIATGDDPLEATTAAGTVLLPREERLSRLLPAAAVVHGSISLFWGVVLAATLPRKRTIQVGSLAGLAITALDLGLIGRRFERMRRLPVAPQLADHLLFGAAVGSVLAARDARAQGERANAAPGGDRRYAAMSGFSPGCHVVPSCQ